MNHLTQEYLDYLQSPEWDQKRKQRLHLDGYTCQDCGAKNCPLDVDHLDYGRFGDEDMSDLQTLCRDCHDYKHGKNGRIFFNRCQTCGEVLSIYAHRVKIFGIWWNDYTCENGHMRSYQDARSPYTT